MTTDSSGSPSGNTATGQANVGVQAGTVHGGVTNLQVLPEDPPERIYEIGLAYLDLGAAGTARELFDKAWAKDYRSNEVTFHWLLALLSRKTTLQLSVEDHDQLRFRLGQPLAAGNDRWVSGINFVRHLLDLESDASTEQLMAFDDLSSRQRSRIVQHLEFLAQGRQEQALWDLAVKEAERKQREGSREDRVWKFFQPDPARPRLRLVAPSQVDQRTWLVLCSLSLIFAVASLYLGFLVALGGSVLFSVAYVMAIASALVALVNGAHWWSCHRAVQARRQVLLGSPSPSASPPPGGFSDDVDEMFDRYSVKYGPGGVKNGVWLTQTAGIRRSIRDEIVRTYRETKTTSPKVAWLIRHRIREVRHEWETGELWQYAAQLRAPLSQRLATVAGLSAAVLGSTCGLMAAAPVDPVKCMVATLLLVASARLAAPIWMHIVDERARVARETSEAEDVLARSWQAFHVWALKLADRPEDSEMATWLDCDRRLLMQRAFEHYHLGPADLIAHAFIDAPAPQSVRARIHSGPWRYRHYALLIFLITEEGVRQVQAGLDFSNGTFSDQNRANYRFDTVATVHVSESSANGGSFELGLLDGQPILIPVAPGITAPEPGENPGVVSKVTRDAAGLDNALHVLEGIAAEGKRWVSLEKRRNKERMEGLAAVLRMSPEDATLQSVTPVDRGADMHGADLPVG